MARALLTDLYELNMAASYLRRGMKEPATFSLFVRRLPPNRGFLVAAGLEECLDFLEGFRFQEDELEYARADLGFDEETVEAFAALRFTGDVWAVPEGTIVFANEPLLEVTGRIAEAQLVETYLLNQVTFQTTIASKAARCRIAASGRDLVDFAFRRTQGVDAAMGVARASAMVGFVATSNVEAARRFGLRAAGTMAHSFIEAFPTETAAFRAFAEDFPGRATFLVDTYDTPRGVRAAIETVRELGLSGRLGIRLDSGDLGALAREARAMLDAAGLPTMLIFASGALDELDIDELVRGGAPIDAFGVGTRMGVSADAPYLDSVYKLVRYGDRPVLKLSPEKATAPGAKQVFRAEGLRDVIGLRDEPAPVGARPILEAVMAGGRRLRRPDPLESARGRFEADLASLPRPARDLRAPDAPVVTFTAALQALAERIRSEQARQGSGREGRRRRSRGRGVVQPRTQEEDGRTVTTRLEVARVAEEVMPTLTAVRGRRQSLEEVLGQVERAIAAPAPRRASEWVRGVGTELSRLRNGFALHIEITEGPGGLHEEILGRAPRLARMVARLQQDHVAIGQAIEQNLASLPPSDREDGRRVAKIREAALALLGRLARHRQLGADLIYEAYNVDIGSGD